MIFNANQFNQNFIRAIKLKEGLQKVASDAQGWIQTSVAEASFLDMVEPSKPAEPGELQRSVDHDEVTMIIDIDDPNDHYAAILNFDAQANRKVYKGKRIEARFVKFESDEIEMNKMQLMASPKDVTDIIKDKIINSIVKKKDAKALELWEAAAKFTDPLSINPYINTARVVQLAKNSDILDRTAIKDLVNKIDGNELIAEKILARRTRWNEWKTQPASDVGDAIAGRMIEDYDPESAKINALKWLVSIKPEMSDDKVFAFAGSKYFCVHRTFGNLEFTIEEKKDKVFMSAYVYELFVIVNVFGVSMLEWI